MSSDDDPGSRTPPGDQDILALLKSGDASAAFDLLYARYGARVAGYCRRMLRDDALAEDVWQRVCFEAHRDLHGLSGGSPRAWFYGIARHRCLDAARRRQIEDRLFTPLGQAPVSAPGGGEEVERELPAAETRVADDDPHQRLWASERGAIVERCLNLLAPRARDALLQHFYLDLAFAEMADISGEKEKTLRKRVQRAMRPLRDCVGLHGVSRHDL